VDVEKAQHWNSRGHFFGAAAEAMRRILVERARSKGSAKHGGERRRMDLDKVELQYAKPCQVDLLALNDALTRLEAKDARKAELVKLKYFAGLTNAQAANTLGVSVSTIDSDWAYARCWLRLQMTEASDGT
jgi:RNA polymerase sigma factor (TIGR02999 family)